MNKLQITLARSIREAFGQWAESHLLPLAVCDTVQKPADRVFLIAHFSAWRSPRAMRIALSGSHRLAGSNGTDQAISTTMTWFWDEMLTGNIQNQ